MNIIKKESGFTLIEMMIVLLIISVLILIAIPNVAKQSQSIDDKGCMAYLKMVQGQIEAYKMDEKGEATLANLEAEGYLPESAQCPDGRDIQINEKGEVIALVSGSDGS
ncbi:competence type IV pilus major pilin ComGC [Sporosarcina sp. CAU 1771]